MEKPMMYDPEFGDHKKCKCGHVYYYHFNHRGGEHFGKHYGCIYSYNCGCEQFEEAPKRMCINCKSK